MPESAHKINEIHGPEHGRKNVLFVITQSEIGGAQQFLARLLETLDPQRFSATIVAGPDGDSELRRMLPADIPYITAKHLRRNPSFSEDMKALFELKKIIQTLGPDVLFLNSSKAGFIGSLAARLTGGTSPAIKVVYRIGGWTFNDPWPRWEKIFYLFLERFSARWKDYIIVNNDKDRQTARNYGIKPRRALKLIYNGINPYMPFLEKEEARLKLFEGEAAFFRADFIVGTIANFYPTKDVITFVRAAALVKRNCVFAVIGDGIMRPQIEAEIVRLGLNKTVFLLGKRTDAYCYVPAFDAFVLSSRKEGFPWVVLEAMAAKVPVISTSVGAASEIITDGKSGFLVQPEAPEQIASRITELLDDDRKRQEFTIQAHQTIVKNFSLREMVDKYERLFSAL